MECLDYMKIFPHQMFPICCFQYRYTQPFLGILVEQTTDQVDTMYIIQYVPSSTITRYIKTKFPCASKDGHYHSLLKSTKKGKKERPSKHTLWGGQMRK